MSEALPYVGAAVGLYFGQPGYGWMIGSCCGAGDAREPVVAPGSPTLKDLQYGGGIDDPEPAP